MTNKIDVNDFQDIIEEMLSFNSAKINFEDSKNYNKITASKEQVSSFSNKKLCILIASNRYIKFNNEVEVACMEEISKRRSSGDTFPFEQEIEAVKSKFTPIDSSITNILSIFTKKI